MYLSTLLAQSRESHNARAYLGEVNVLAYEDFKSFTCGRDRCVPYHKGNPFDETGPLLEELRRGKARGVPINSVICVPSRGFKNRIVTKSHPGLVTRAEPLRQSLFNVLALDPRVTSVLKGLRRRAV